MTTDNSTRIFDEVHGASNFARHLARGFCADYEGGQRTIAGPFGMCWVFNQAMIKVGIEGIPGRLCEGSMGYVLGRAVLDSDAYANGLGACGVFTEERYKYCCDIVEMPRTELVEKMYKVIVEGQYL